MRGGSIARTPGAVDILAIAHTKSVLVTDLLGDVVMLVDLYVFKEIRVIFISPVERCTC